MFRPAAWARERNSLCVKTCPRVVHCTLDIPSHHDIAIGLVPPQTIVQKAKSGWNRAVVARIVAMLHVYEDPALGRHQTRKLTENLRAAAGGKDVSEDIPETRDDVKLGVDQMKFFGPHGPEFRAQPVPCIATLGSTRTRSAMFRACAIRRARRRRRLRHRAWSGFQAGSPEITSRSMPSRYGLRFSAMRANTGPMRS